MLLASSAPLVSSFISSSQNEWCALKSSVKFILKIFYEEASLDTEILNIIFSYK